MNLTKLKSPLLLPLTILLLLLLNAIIIANLPTEVLAENLSMRNYIGQYHGPEYFFYENYDQVDKRVVTLVVGDIVREYPTISLPSEAAIVSFRFAIFDIKVSNVIKGSCSPGDTIKVKQMVLSHTSITYFKEGERHIFFLGRTANGIPASPISDLQGDILIVDGKTKRANNVQFINDDIPEDAAVKALSKRVDKLKLHPLKTPDW